VAGCQLVQVRMKLYAYRMMVNVTGGYLFVSLMLQPARRISHMWMNRLVTLSSEWKTSEFLQVMIALARGPDDKLKALPVVC